MKHALIALGLAATVSLGACAAPGEHSYVRQDDKLAIQTVRGDQLAREDVRSIQTSLARQGYYNDVIDGIWGPRTSQAILDYQAARSADGRGLTAETLEEFGVRMERDSSSTAYQ